MADETAGAPLGVHHRVRLGLRQRHNWLQLTRFVVVGGSGFVTNLGAYALCVHAFGMDYRLAALVALFAGVANNFVWHRFWTFDAREGDARGQALRFTVVYGVTFVIGLGILQAFVSGGTSRVIGQALSQILITPLNFLGHKLWSFDERSASD